MKLRSLTGAAASEWSSNRLKLIAGTITVLVLVPGIYMLFRFLFDYIYSLESTFSGFGFALARRLMAMTFMTLGVFIGISSFISGVSVVFRSWETSFLLNMPLKDSFTASYRMIESWMNAGWATFLLGIPIVMAFCVSLDISASATVVSCLIFSLLIAVWLGAGTLLLGASIRLSRRSGKVWRTAGILGLVVAAGLVIVLRNSAPSGIIAEENAALNAVQQFVADLPVAGGKFWPHMLFSNSIIAMDNGEWMTAMGQIGILFMEALVMAAGAFLVLCPGFRKRYSSVSMNAGRRKTNSRFFRSGDRLKVMLQKDLLLFFRDPVQWGQLFLLAGLFLVYAFNIDRFPKDIGHGFWRSILVYLNFSFSCFVSATLLVRFAFPSISLEGPGLSHIIQLPKGRRRLINVKWIESFLYIVPFMVGIGIWSTLRINAGSLLMTVSTVSLTLMCVALVSINVALGAVFPRFEKGSAANIASGQGGIIAAFASMGYVLVMITVLGMTLRGSFTVATPVEAYSGSIYRALAFMAGITLIASFGFIRAAYSSFAGRDF